MQTYSPYKQHLGAIIPNAILECTELTSTEKLVWARLAQFCGHKSYCWPSQDAVASAVGISVVQAKKVLRSMHDKQFIHIENPEGFDRVTHRTNRYHMIWHPILQDAGNVRDLTDGIAESSQDDTPRGIPEDTSEVSQRIPPRGIPEDTSSVRESDEESQGEDSVGTSEDRRPRRTAIEPKKRQSELKEHPRWTQFARTLASAIAIRHKVNYTSKIGQWALAFYQLHKTDGVPCNDIRDVLDWYAKAFVENADPYLPVCESGRAFREKWAKLLNAKARSEGVKAGRKKTDYSKGW